MWGGDTCISRRRGLTYNETETYILKGQTFDQRGTHPAPSAMGLNFNGILETSRLLRQHILRNYFLVWLNELKAQTFKFPHIFRNSKIFVADIIQKRNLKNKLNRK